MSNTKIHETIGSNLPTSTTLTRATLAYRQQTFQTKRSLSESSVSDYQQYTTKKNLTLLKSSINRNGKFKKSSSNGKQQGTNFVDSCIDQRYHFISNLVDIMIRVIAVLIFCKMEITDAFQRKIHLEELWLYKNPRKPDIVSPNTLLLTVVFCPLLATLVHRYLTNDRRDFRAASWTWTMILCINGICTSLLKITVGRPRPDFFYRCFPDGIMILNNYTESTNLGDFDLFNCTGNAHIINEGRKSFPSGHSSFAFASFGFICFYIGAKLHAFNSRGRSQSWRLCISIVPLILASLVAVSRYCDYHHHWQDVVVGSAIGLTASYFVYRQYYPSIFARNCHRPYPRKSSITFECYNENKNSYMRLPVSTESDNEDNFIDNEDSSSQLFKPINGLLGNQVKANNKWI